MYQTTPIQKPDFKPLEKKSTETVVLISSASSTTQTLIDPISDQYRCLMQLKSSAVTRVPDCDSDPLEIPDWFDRTLFDLGRKVAQKHFFSFFVCHLVGLVALVHYLPIMRTLLTTGNSSNLRNLFWRYLNTARHVRLWYEGDVWNPQDSAHKSLALVRSMHLHASRSRNVGAESKTDLNFSQYDMHLTQVNKILFISVL